MSIIGGRLSLARKEKNLTQQQLAAQLGIQQSQISHFETDKEEPSKELILQFINILDVSLDYLEGRTPDERLTLSIPEYSSSFACRIRAIRKYYQKSQVEFSRDLSISQSALSSLENGTTLPSLSIIQRLGEMGYDLHWIVYGGEENRPENIMSLTEEPSMGAEISQIKRLLVQLPVKKVRAIRKIIGAYVEGEL